MARYRWPLRNVISSDGASRAMKSCDCENGDGSDL